MKQPYEMSFEEFATNVKPSGAINRLPQIGSGHDVLVYSVYMNGPGASMLPQDVMEQTYRDVMLHALTEKLGLNPNSFRDNLKVAELVATRSAWMASVLDLSLLARSDNTEWALSEDVVRDYEVITDGMNHPWIQDQIKQQLALSISILPALNAAESVIGKPVAERAPDEVNSGVVVSQNTDFTVQDMGDGNVVAHENRRLETLPEVGKSVTVTYYRGTGQVCLAEQGMSLSSPYIDEATKDLAVKLIGVDGTVNQILLFNGVSSFEKFMLDQASILWDIEGKIFSTHEVIKLAVDARAITPKPVPVVEKPVRTPVGELYVDYLSSCIAADYMENGLKYKVLFVDSEHFADLLDQFGFDNDRIQEAQNLEQKHGLPWASKNSSMIRFSDELSMVNAEESALKVCSTHALANRDKGKYVGEIFAESELHVVQNIGRDVAVIHRKTDLDKVPSVGNKISVSYHAGRGEVMSKETAKGLGR